MTNTPPSGNLYKVDSEVAQALQLLFPSETAGACMRPERLTPADLRQAYDNRMKEIHPTNLEEIDPGDLEDRERRFHELTAAYYRLLAFLKQSGKEENADPANRPHADTRRSVVVAVASGSQMAGSTFIAANLATALSGAGHRTLALDLDGTGLPLARLLGAPGTDGCLDGLIQNPDLDLSDLESHTAFAGLRLAGGPGGVADLNLAGTPGGVNVLKGLRRSENGFVIMDLGDAGKPAWLDLLASADVRLIVSGPEPESYLGAYQLMNRMVQRLLLRYRAINPFPAGQALNHFNSYLQGSRDREKGLTPRWLLTRLLRDDREAYKKVSSVIRARLVDLVINRVRNQKPSGALVRLIAMTKNELDLTVREVHSIPEDRQIYLSLRADNPLMTTHPDGKAARSVIRTARKIFFPDSADADRIICRRLRETGAYGAGLSAVKSGSIRLQKLASGGSS